MEEEKAAREKRPNTAERKERAARVKESIARHEHYMEEQQKKRNTQKEAKEKELKEVELAKARA